MKDKFLFARTASEFFLSLHVLVLLLSVLAYVSVLIGMLLRCEKRGKEE